MKCCIVACFKFAVYFTGIVFYKSLAILTAKREQFNGPETFGIDIG
jgi:hypothetical protein